MPKMIDFLDIIHHRIFIKNDVSETGLYLCPQVKILFRKHQSIELFPISWAISTGDSF
jgi:hypothetical protein